MMVLKKGTQVKVISGKDKGKTGEILEINRKLQKVKVKTINIVKYYNIPATSPPPKNTGGTIGSAAGTSVNVVLCLLSVASIQLSKLTPNNTS